MTSDTLVRARIDKELKAKAARVLADMGMSVSDAIRLLLSRIAADKALPFEVKTPNAETEAAMQELEGDRAARFSTVTDLITDLNADD
ncbi:MAG: type II toxin-antitoxin system RelB/DinJ family antitoxin [Alphaproteobacteria bacterium]|nr:type II toxin-antitoxin system RelB/DinJ family antitoxin [Alphaproteobacteria bacterium]